MSVLERHRPGDRTVGQVPADTTERVAAVVALLALGFRYDLTAGVTAGTAVGVVLLPVWYRVFLRYRFGLLPVVLVGLALANGALLAGLARGSRHLAAREAVSASMLLLEIVVGVGLLLWARTVLPDWQVAAWFGIGMCAWALYHPTGAGLNVWKFDLAIPVGVLATAMASRARGVVVGIVVALGLAAVSVVFDSRAYASALVLVALLLGWRALPGFRAGRRSWIGVVAIAAAVAGVLYVLASQLLVSGLLGQSAAERSQAQIQLSGSLILGGRPEIAASWALFTYRPLGFGLGVVPSYRDVLAAKTGMLRINYDPNNGYVDTYMFGGRFELHSIVGDLFALAGPGGLLLALGIAAAAVVAVGRGIATRTGTPALFFAAVWTLWNVPFSPLVVSVPVVTLLAGLVLVPAPGRGTAGPAPGAAPAVAGASP